MSVTVTVVLDTCGDCRHVDHSGAFTPSGAKQICDHDLAVDFATRAKPSVKNERDRFHWRHRIIKKFPKIPGWCPLKHGGAY